MCAGPEPVRKGRIDAQPDRAAAQLPSFDTGDSRASSNVPKRLQRPNHHERIDVSVPRMVKALRQTTDDGEAEVLPEPDGTFVCADDEIELHCAEPLRLRKGQRVTTHRARDAAPASHWS